MRVTGTVKWFDQLRGFGAIGRALGESDCVVHHSAMRGTVYRQIAAGDHVEFDIVHGETGAVARDVIRLACSVPWGTLPGGSVMASAAVVDLSGHS